MGYWAPIPIRPIGIEAPPNPINIYVKLFRCSFRLFGTMTHFCGSVAKFRSAWVVYMPFDSGARLSTNDTNFVCTFFFCIKCVHSFKKLNVLVRVWLHFRLALPFGWHEPTERELDGRKHVNASILIRLHHIHDDMRLFACSCSGFAMRRPMRKRKCMHHTHMNLHSPNESFSFCHRTVFASNQWTNNNNKQFKGRHSDVMNRFWFFLLRYVCLAFGQPLKLSLLRQLSTVCSQSIAI